MPEQHFVAAEWMASMAGQGQSGMRRRGRAACREAQTMSYGHAERNLAAIRQVEAETRELLLGLGELDPEQEQWLKATAPSASERHGVLAAQGSARSR
jgi:hypothetical protein